MHGQLVIIITQRQREAVIEEGSVGAAPQAQLVGQIIFLVYRGCVKIGYFNIIILH